jgi:hypothetical protein
LNAVPRRITAPSDEPHRRHPDPQRQERDADRRARTRIAGVQRKPGNKPDQATDGDPRALHRLSVSGRVLTPLEEGQDPSLHVGVLVGRKMIAARKVEKLPVLTFVWVASGMRGSVLLVRAGR